MRVVDLGGTVGSWLAAPVRPQQVVLVNDDARENPPEAGQPGIQVVLGDACDLPPAVRDERFDLVYSNSVIEHVGGHWRRAAFAASVHRLSDRHWVQTPYRYFPLEPHFLFPGFALLPLRAQAEVVRRWPLGHYAAVRELREAVRWSLATELLSFTELRHYFPSSQIQRERVLGLTKSLIATA